MTDQTTKVGDVTVTLKPSEQIVKAAAKEVKVTDALGRVITLKKPSILANLSFSKAAGDDKINILYLSEISHLKYVTAIDDDVIITPSSEGELKALLLRLDYEGSEAALAGVAEHFMPKSPESKDAELKNS
jgi:hypothetical protein